MDDQERDQNVFSFMMQLVQEKHGDDSEPDFLDQEAGRLYDIFGDILLEYFEPQLSEDQKKQFDEMFDQESQEDDLLGFLMQNINDLEEQMVNLLVKFRNDYLKGTMEKKGEEFKQQTSNNQAA